MKRFICYQVLIILALSNIYEAADLCEDTCGVEKQFLILFDERQNMEDLLATQQFISKIARGVRSASDRNRVAVGTFSEIKSSFEDSQYRMDHAFEQTILDLDLIPIATSNLKDGVTLADTTIKAANNGKTFVVLFVIASKGNDGGEDSKIEEGIKKIVSENSKLVGYVVGIGKNIHEGTLSAVTDGKTENRQWRVSEASDLQELEYKMLFKLSCVAAK